MSTLKTGLVLLTLFLAGPVVGAELDTIKADCENCHGPGGVSAYPEIPTIAGQTPKFLSATLRSFKNWDRPCVKSSYRTGDTQRPRTDMCQIAGKLSDDQVAALAGQFSDHAFISAEQPFDAALASEGAVLHEQSCESCHENGGKTAGRAPRIAGQWTKYMRATLRFVPTGEHLVPPLMERSVADLPVQDIDRLMNFYASQQD